MGKRLSVKNKKNRRDLATAYKNGELVRAHKVAEIRSTKAKFRKNNRMA